MYAITKKYNNNYHFKILFFSIIILNCIRLFLYINEFDWTILEIVLLNPMQQSKIIVILLRVISTKSFNYIIFCTLIFDYIYILTL